MANQWQSDVGPAAHALTVVRQIIDDRGLKPGDRLPAERDLAAAAQVSRTTLRAALDQLEVQGMLTRHVGRGTYLTPPLPDIQSIDVHDYSPAEVMAARIAVEPQLMPLVVVSATNEDLTEMRRRLQAGEAALTSIDFEDADAALHHSFAIATHNTLLITFSQLLIDARHHPVWGSLKQRSFSPERKRCYCAEHAAIVEAIADRDGPAAQKATTDHLAHVRTNLLG